MKTKGLITMGLLLGLGSGLQAGFESPGPGPDLDALTGGDQERPWSFWVRTVLGYDDNVQFVPDAGAIGADEESVYFGIMAEGAYELMDNGSTNAGVAIRIDQTFHFEDSGAGAPDNFDLTVVEPALYVNHTSGCWYGRAAYSFRWEDTDGSPIGVESHNLGVMIGTEFNSGLHGQLEWVHGWDDFDVAGAGVAERDGDRDRVSVSLISEGSGTSPRMILRYSYKDNDADGSNFRYEGHELMFRVEGNLADRLDGAVQITYEDRDYSTGARSEQEIFGAGVQLVYRVDDNWSADFFYNYLDVDSNATFFRGERNHTGVGLRYDF